MPVSWQEFRKLHKGTPQREISELWARYKNADYDLPPAIPTTANESDGPAESYIEERTEDEKEVLDKLSEPEDSESKKMHEYMIIVPEPVAPEDEPTVANKTEKAPKRKAWKKVKINR